MRKTQAGAATGKILLLLVFVGAFVGFFVWKQNYGAVGRVKRLNFDTKGSIAFVRMETDGTSNVYVVNSETGDPKPLTIGSAPRRSPCWSPSGKELCYAEEVSSAGATTFQLFLLGAEAPRQLTYGSLSKDLPRWSPDGSKIAYLSGGAIKVVSANGADLDQIYPPPHKDSGNHEEAQPGQSAPPEADEMKRPPITLFQWSPNSAGVAGVQVTEGENAVTLGSSDWWQGSKAVTPGEEGEVQVVDAESLMVLPSMESGKPIVLPGGNKVGFAWLPDSKRIVVAVSSRHNRHSLAVARVDEKGLPQQRLFEASGFTVAPENPAVSPDGRKVVCELWRLDSTENRKQLGLLVLDLESAAETRVSGAGDIGRLRLVVKGDARSPQWSADSSKLLYVVQSKSGRDVWVASADGSGARNLTKGVGDNFDAVWSPTLK